MKNYKKSKVKFIGFSKSCKYWIELDDSNGWPFEYCRKYEVRTPKCEGCKGKEIK